MSVSLFAVSDRLTLSIMCERQNLNTGGAKGLDKSCCLREYNYYASVQGDVTQTTDDRLVLSQPMPRTPPQIQLSWLYIVYSQFLIVLSRCMRIIFRMVCRFGGDLMQLWESEIMFGFKRGRRIGQSGNSAAKPPLKACRGLEFPLVTQKFSQRDVCLCN